jgi:hypothetical protein
MSAAAAAATEKRRPFRTAQGQGMRARAADEQSTRHRATQITMP